MTEEDMSSSNLTLRLLRSLDRKIDALDRKLDAKIDALDHKLEEFRRETNERLVALEQTVSGLATHMFMLTDYVKKVDRRVHKLEARSAK
jgi:predicted  nucleic acid-binding Zn-ribbon protein